VKPELIARQSRQPSGWLGEIVARVMSVETAAANRSAVRRLAPAPGENVLEVGCGHGRTLRAILANGAAHVAGIDPSSVMAKLATRRLQREIASGRAAVELAEAAQLPFEGGCFDAVLAVHVLYFWPHAERELGEIRRVLRPGGRLLLGFRPKDAASVAALPPSVYTLRSEAEVADALADAGFERVRVEPEPGASPPMAWGMAFASAAVQPNRADERSRSC